MPGVVKPLVYLALITIVIAVVGSFTGSMMGIGSEAFSRACTNLALLAIAIGVAFKEEGSAG